MKSSSQICLLPVREQLAAQPACTTGPPLFDPKYFVGVKALETLK